MMLDYAITRGMQTLYVLSVYILSCSSGKADSSSGKRISFSRQVIWSVSSETLVCYLDLNSGVHSPGHKSLTSFSGWWQRHVFLESVAYCIEDIVYLLLIIMRLPGFTLQLFQHTTLIIKATFLLQGGHFLDWHIWGPGSDLNVKLQWTSILCLSRSVVEEAYAVSSQQGYNAKCCIICQS